MLAQKAATKTAPRQSSKVASSTKQFSPNERAKKQRTVDVEEKAQEDIDHMLLETLTPLLDEVEDIDILDARDPQYVSLYARDIHDHLKKKEVSLQPDHRKLI